MTFIGDNKAKVNGYINDQNLVERVETWIDNPFLGDMLFEAIYSDYKDVGGAQFPMHIVQKQGGYPIFDLNVTDVKANAAVNIQAPQGRGGAPAAAAAAANPPAQSEKLGDGVYLITGGYAVIAVDFKDYIALIECGQNEPRALAVIAEAKRLIPNKPIKYVINTHSHIDHSSGLRAFVAEGATIITHQVNKAYLEKVLSLPHTLNPDKAQSAGKKPIVEGDRREESADRRHARHRAVSPAELPAPRRDAHRRISRRRRCCSRPMATIRRRPRRRRRVRRARTPSSLLDNIQRLKLDVQRIVPVHYPADNRVVTMAELTRWVGRTGSAN